MYTTLMKATRFPLAVGFTLLEVLAVLAAMAAIGALGYATVRDARTNVKSAKLESDVDSINRSIQIFQSGGGSLAGLTTTDAVLAKLKTKGDSSKILGVTGSALDARVYAVNQTSAEAATGSKRAVWNSGASRFQIATSGGIGVREFLRTEGLAAGAAATDTTRTAAKETSAGDGWVWEHTLVAEAAAATGTTPQTGLADSGQAVLTNLGLDTGDFTVDPNGNGNVTFDYGYREAGYSQRVGFFSLDGMDIYDLTTDAGRKAFLLEAMRRVLSDTTDGHIVLDASTSTPGSTGQTFAFRPGDHLGSIVIPNTSFASARSALAADNGTLANYSANHATASPLVSVAKYGEDIPSFYAKQFVSVGNGVIAVEDMPTLTTGALVDYQDAVFTTTGMSTNPNMNKLVDASGNVMSATAYYTTGPGKTNAPSGWNWDQKTNGSTQSLHEFLFARGVAGVAAP